jgi:hypothetical protein
MNLIDSPKSLKSLKIRFELSLMALSHLATLEWHLGLPYWRLMLKLKIGTNYLNITIEL